MYQNCKDLNSKTIDVLKTKRMSKTSKTSTILPNWAETDLIRDIIMIWISVSCEKKG